MLDLGLEWHHCLVNIPSGRTCFSLECLGAWGAVAVLGSFTPWWAMWTASLSGHWMCLQRWLWLHVLATCLFQPPPTPSASSSGCLVGAVPQQQRCRCWALCLKAGPPQRHWDALGCDLLVESKSLQLQEIMCVPSWEHSVSDKQGLWVWRTSGYMVTCLPLSCSVGDAAPQSGSARVPLSWRIFVLG